MIARFITLTAVSCALSASIAQAQPLMQYDYLDAAYEWTHFDEDGIDDANGLDSKISYSPVDNFALEGGYNYLNAEIANVDVGAHTFAYGALGWIDFCEDLDLVGRVGGLHVDNTSSVANESDDGVYAGAQVRYLLTETIEGDVDVLYTDIGNAQNWTYGLTGLFTVAENVALKVGSTINDDSDVTVLGGFRLAM